jgi:hypothetical protein
MKTTKKKIKEIKKPLLQSISFYDWNDAFEYIKFKYGSKLRFKDDVLFDKNGDTHSIWNHICDNHEVHNGGTIRLSDWELKTGEFAYMVPEWYVPILNAFLDEFGTVDTDCLTPNTRIADFQTIW